MKNTTSMFRSVLVSAAKGFNPTRSSSRACPTKIPITPVRMATRVREAEKTAAAVGSGDLRWSAINCTPPISAPVYAAASKIAIIAILACSVAPSTIFLLLTSSFRSLASRERTRPFKQPGRHQTTHSLAERPPAPTPIPLVLFAAQTCYEARVRGVRFGGGAHVRLRHASLALSRNTSFKA